jgi:four helix bundle protein
MKDFKQLMIWQKSMDLFINIHKMAAKLPSSEKYEISSQLKRAAFSIPSNIAEGSAKATNAHYKVFIENALGSAYETETGLIAISRLYENLKEEVNVLLERTTEIQRMLIGFTNKLK